MIYTNPSSGLAPKFNGQLARQRPQTPKEWIKCDYFAYGVSVGFRYPFTICGIIDASGEIAQLLTDISYGVPGLKLPLFSVVLNA